jgi:tetratricopeptide (TPR) repeat protein
MKRLSILLAATLMLAGCATFHDRDANVYDEPQFYEKYLNQGNAQDRQIASTLASLRTNADSAPLHNDLGALLVQKGFPKDAAVEFERAIDADRRFYPAWYNLGLLRKSMGDGQSARSAFRRTLRYKPGHGAALFQMGLIEEKRGKSGNAVELYAKAFRIDRSLLEVRSNPEILESKLIHLALLESYPERRATQVMDFQNTPAGYIPPEKAPSKQADPAEIVTPAAPATDQGRQTTPPGE